MNWKSDGRLSALLLLTALSTFFLLFMEWLFFVTKLSFLSGLSTADKLLTLVAAPLVPGVIAMFLVAALFLISKASDHPFYRNFCIALAETIPALILAASTLLLIDNFSNSVFHFGIHLARGFVKSGYVALFCLLVAVLFRSVKRWENNIAQKLPAIQIARIAAVLIVVWLIAGLYSAFTDEEIASSERIGALKGRVPNILLIGSDGVSAEHMSTYGYARQTTPFISRFAQQGLVCENAFPNCGETLGSITSILTGRLPTENGVIYTPDILRGADAYEHLPGILKRYGYRTFQITVRNFADAYEVNMRNAFDSVNYRTTGHHAVAEMLGKIISLDAVYFLEQTYERVRERISHIFGGEEMSNAFAEVTQTARKYRTDEQRLSGLFTEIQSSKGPFFGHIHFMVTHGNKFSPHRRIFSAGHLQSDRWMIDFYDDSVLEFDQTFKQVIQFLRGSGRLNNTIVVLYSDHGLRHDINARVPLIFWFPSNHPRGRWPGSVENIDIAPTILGYLGLQKPDWMTGESILSAKPDSCRWIVSVKAAQAKARKEGRVQIAEMAPPFYTLGALSITVCNQYQNLNVNNARFESGTIDTYVGQCGSCTIPPRTQLFNYMVAHLKRNGYRTDPLERAAKLDGRPSVASATP